MLPISSFTIKLSLFSVAVDKLPLLVILPPNWLVSLQIDLAQRAFERHVWVCDLIDR